MRRPDQELVDLAQKARSGDVEAFTELFNRLSAPVLNYIYRMLGDEAAAQDVTQDAFIRAYDHLDQLGPPWDVKSWIYRIAGNLCIDYLRSRRQFVDVEESEPMPDPGSSRRPAEQDVQQEQFQEDVWRVLSTLPTQYRQALVLREFNGLGYQELAQALDCSYANVRQVVHRARLRFRDAYGWHRTLMEGVERCRVLGDLLSAYRDGELDEQQELAVRQHMATCPECKANSDDMKKVGAMMGFIPVLVPSKAWAAGVVQRIHAHASISAASGSAGVQESQAGFQAASLSKPSGPAGAASVYPAAKGTLAGLKSKIGAFSMGAALALGLLLALGLAGILAIWIAGFMFSLSPSAPTVPAPAEVAKASATPWPLPTSPGPSPTAPTAIVPTEEPASSPTLIPSPTITPTPTASPTPTDSTPPSVSVSHSPVGRDRPNTSDVVTFYASASDPSGIARIEIWLLAPGSQLPKIVLTCPYAASCTYQGGPYPAGTGQYYGVAYDLWGNSGVSPRSTLTVYRALQ